MAEYRSNSKQYTYSYPFLYISMRTMTETRTLSHHLNSPILINTAFDDRNCHHVRLIASIALCLGINKSHIYINAESAMVRGLC